MTTIIVHLAEGFEEMEALIPVDVWRRAGFQVKMVSITQNLVVMGSHQIKVIADELFEDCDYSQANMLFLPGGMPGAKNLDAHPGLRKQLINFAQNGKMLGAICAAPLVLGHNELLKNKKATCFPGFEHELLDAIVTGASVESDGQIITGKGAGIAMDFALEVVKKFKGEQFALELARKMQIPGI